MAFNRKLPPDDVLADHFRDGMTGGEIAAKYNSTPSAVTQAKMRMIRAGVIGDDSPARRYPQESERITVRRSELQIKFSTMSIFISLPRITMVDGPYQGNQS